jgi:ABC-2 type transport system ATP-binding protein
MRVGEYLAFRAGLKQVPRKRRHQACELALEQAGVNDLKTTLIGHLSKGYRQRVALADALVADPPLLILDEPTSGLDPNQIREVRKLIKKLSRSRTILLSTHILSEVEASCDRALVINKGQIVLEGSLNALFDETLSAVLTLRDSEARAQKLLLSLESTDSVELLENQGDVVSLRLRLTHGSTPKLFEGAVQKLVQASIGVQAVERDKPRLEDVFSQLTENPELPEETHTK